VAVIAAEDTRRTARLLQHYSISTPTTSLHAHNERARIPQLITRLQAGDSIAIVSDAGTPLISDPGAPLVAAAHAASIRVEPIPGPSAALAAVSASGLSGDQILFVGFPPSRSIARKKWFADLSGHRGLIVLYEAPHRIRETLRDLRELLGERMVAVGRELTKLHEELVVRPISEHVEAITEPRGEYTVVVSPPAVADQLVAVPDQAALLAEFGQLAKTRLGTRRDLIRELAAKYHLPPKQIYRLLEQNTQE
jgi:16S rRNA (cytidine1402-2'-O)-methyltransferase